MKITSAQAAKLIRKYNDELDSLYSKENSSSTFLASLGEDPESLRPDYCFEEMQEKQKTLEEKIRKLRHCLNVFNSTQTVPGFDMTIDEILILLPQLRRRSQKLSSMKDALPKTRDTSSYGSNIIDYRYTSYDPAQAAAEYDEVSDELARAQTALDLVNSTVEFEADI